MGNTQRKHLNIKFNEKLNKEIHDTLCLANDKAAITKFKEGLKRKFLFGERKILTSKLSDVILNDKGKVLTTAYNILQNIFDSNVNIDDFRRTGSSSVALYDSLFLYDVIEEGSKDEDKFFREKIEVVSKLLGFSGDKDRDSMRVLTTSVEADGAGVVVNTINSMAMSKVSLKSYNSKENLEDDEGKEHFNVETVESANVRNKENENENSKEIVNTDSNNNINTINTMNNENLSPDKHTDKDNLGNMQMTATIKQYPKKKEDDVVELNMSTPIKTNNNKVVNDKSKSITNKTNDTKNINYNTNTNFNKLNNSNTNYNVNPNVNPYVHTPKSPIVKKRTYKKPPLVNIKINLKDFVKQDALEKSFLSETPSRLNKIPIRLPNEANMNISKDHTISNVNDSSFHDIVDVLSETKREYLEAKKKKASLARAQKSQFGIAKSKSPDTNLYNNYSFINDAIYRSNIGVINNHNHDLNFEDDTENKKNKNNRVIYNAGLDNRDRIMNNLRLVPKN